MKLKIIIKNLLLCLLSILAFSCQDEGRQDLMNPMETDKEPDSIQTLTGEFIYVSDAAVFRGDSFVYGVTIDSMAQVLADKVQPYKKEDFDMVSVKIKGKIVPNVSNEGWDENIQIREIIDVLEAEKVSEENE